MHPLYCACEQCLAAYDDPRDYPQPEPEPIVCEVCGSAEACALVTGIDVCSEECANRIPASTKEGTEPLTPKENDDA